MTTVHLGVDLARFGPRPGAAATLRRRYGTEPKGPWVLYVGNEQPRKNLTVLVEALAHLRRGGVPVHWVKVGAPVYEPGRTELLRQIDRHGLSSHVTIIDHVPDDLPLFYQAAIVYAQLSIWEGSGLPVLESMASGTPVVAAATGALPEVCGDTTLLVDSRDAGKLAMGLGSLLMNEEQRGRLRTLGLRHVQRFTWTETARRTIRIYRSLLPETRGGQLRRGSSGQRGGVLNILRRDVARGPSPREPSAPRTECVDVVPQAGENGRPPRGNRWRPSATEPGATGRRSETRAGMSDFSADRG